MPAHESHVAPAMPGPASLPVVAAVAAIVAVYAPIFPPLVAEWRRVPSLSHGFAVPLIAAYLVWSRRGRLGALTASPRWGGLPLVAAGLALYAVATVGFEPFLARVSFPVTLLGGVLLVGGSAVARELIPGIGYLLFMVPLPYLTLKALTGAATLLDASVAAAVLPWLGVPVFRQGVLLHLPDMTLEVADACSSIPAIASLLALGAACGVVRQRSPRVTLLLLGAAVPLGVASNIVRIALTAAGVHHLGPGVLHSVAHTWHGTLVFLMTFAALSAIDAGVARRRRR